MIRFDYKTFLPTLPSRPGVYCMYDKAGKVLYIGKAKQLRNRLASYFRTQEDPRVAQFVAKIARIDITVTYSEKEALLLENSLIKSLKPRYNVLFRDDKSYPYLFLSKHPFPRLVYFRGKQKIPGKYFGPFPSAAAVRETLNSLQKLFKLRQCDDQFFNHRSRPCLQYQIQRCTAPCVGYVTEEAYQEQVKSAFLFLEGKETTIIDNLVKKMEVAARDQDYELAASLRDEIQSLRTVHDQQMVYRHDGNVDVIAAAEFKGHFCLQLLYIRQGRILDSQSFFPKLAGVAEISQVLRSFLIQFYLGKESKLDFPSEIVLNETIEDQELIASTLSQTANRKVKILRPLRGNKAKWLALALDNATQALNRRAQHMGSSEKRWQDLKKALGLTQQNIRIECFDISHLQSEATVASCVVFDQTGPVKEEYRRYHLDVPPSDDYAAMEQVLSRRYIKRKTEELPLPEMIMVDGGKGQLHRAKKVMTEYQILDVCLVGIAKGAGRKPGLETLYVTKMQSDEEWIVKLPPTSPALHLLQQIRDEAHRFAITGQRQKIRAARKHSPLEAIEGVGVKRRQALINYFGGQQGLLAASCDAIAQVPGISKSLAAKIYAVLHPH
ncbi:MAG: excinuclease ABC subunit UvrC [Candidatus Berkiellales bacterium]